MAKKSKRNRPLKIATVKRQQVTRHRVIGQDGTVLYTASSAALATAFMNGYTAGVKAKLAAVAWPDDKPEDKGPPLPLDDRPPWE